MQSVFSRAAQAHVCSCRPCFMAANTVIRRSATATARRKATATDIFTACYTTILGTAAVADAHHKKKRRDDLDRRLDEARDGLARLKDDSTVGDGSDVCDPLHTPQLAISDRSVGLLDTINTICNPNLPLDSFQNRTPQRGRLLDHVYRTFGHEIEVPLPDADFNSIEKAMKVEEEDPGLQHREPVNPTQMDGFRNMINQLVDALVMHVYRLDHPDDPEAMRRSLESLDSVWTAIRLLRSEGYPRYIHGGMDDDAKRTARKELIGINRNIFSIWDRSQAKYLVGKMSYNILVPHVPPTIHTFNALILGFTRVREHTLSQIVVNTMLEESKFRPTTQTIVCVLHHYRAKGDIVGFYSFIRYVFGLDPHEFFSRRKTIREVMINPGLQEWARSPDVVKLPKQQWFAELVERDNHVYEALVSGLLQFDRVQDAGLVFVACLKENCSLGGNILLTLIRRCLWTLDRVAVGILVRGFLENAQAVASILSAPDCPKRLPRYTHILLNFVTEFYRSHPDQDTLTAPSRDMQKSYLFLSTIIFIKETERYLHILGGILQRVQLGLATPNLPIINPTHKASSKLCSLEKLQTMAEIEATRYGTMMLYYDVQKTITPMQKKIQYFERQLINILCRSQPASSLMQDIFRTGELSLTTRLQLYHAMSSRPIFSCARLTHEFKETLLSLFPSEERRSIVNAYDTFSDIPSEALVTKLRARAESDSAGGAGPANSASRTELMQFAGEPMSRQQPVSSFTSWEPHCT